MSGAVLAAMNRAWRIQCSRTSKPKQVPGPELARPEQVAAAVAGAVEHRAAVEPVRVEVLQVDPVLGPDVLEGDVRRTTRE